MGNIHGEHHDVFSSLSYVGLPTKLGRPQVARAPVGARNIVVPFGGAHAG